MADLLFDWNNENYCLPNGLRTVELCDETLRDGLQSPSVNDPQVEDKCRLVSLMDDLGITIADIGLPAAGPRALSHVTQIAKYIRDNKLNLKANCAGRTLVGDLEPIVRVQEEVGIPIAAYTFLGTSPIRQYVEDWDMDKLLRSADEAVSFAVKNNLEVAFVTEDTTRSNPKVLERLFTHVISLGCKRLVLCDTVGYASPNGILQLVNFTKDIIKKSRENVKIDWHGHNDRGLGLVNALFAAEYGCDRIHGTALGVGERVGNSSLDQIIVNLKIMGGYQHDVTPLVEYVELASKICEVPIPYNYPLCGVDAFRTATGVHAAAVIKAEKKGDPHLADVIYSSVPAKWFGKEQSIEIGPMSGISNVKYWLVKRNIEATDALCQKIFKEAKRSKKILSNQELEKIVAKH